VTIGEMLEHVCSNTPGLTPLGDVARLEVLDGAALARHSKFVSRARVATLALPKARAAAYMLFKAFYGKAPSQVG